LPGRQRCHPNTQRGYATRRSLRRTAHLLPSLRSLCPGLLHLLPGLRSLRPGLPHLLSSLRGISPRATHALARCGRFSPGLLHLLSGRASRLPSARHLLPGLRSLRPSIIQPSSSLLPRLRASRTQPGKGLPRSLGAGN
jgi:hypothetical protein